jgi:hypothetical protein
MKKPPKKKRPYVCGLEASLDLVNGKWKPLILRAIRKGSRRYSELRRAVVGVSDKMLIMHLKELEADHVVTRKDLRIAPNTLGESKRGRHSQSTDPSRLTRAALCMSPTMTWFSIGS